MTRKSMKFLFLAAALTFALGVAGCGGDDDEGEGAEEGATGGTLVFAGAADPVVLDGALVSDGESLRVIDQLFEGLVTLEPGTTEVIPALATSWETSEDGLEWTFSLREGVTFHDGEPFNAEAVCFNFDRWYNFPAAFQNPNASYYWQFGFGGGFADPIEGAAGPEESIYRSCEAVDEHTVTLVLTRSSAAFLPALSLPSLAFHSPAALQEFGADEGNVDEEGVFRPTGTYGTQHPTGTGPFKFESWDRASQEITLVRNEDYWGEPASIARLVFRAIPDENARRQALLSGEVHVLDQPNPGDWASLEAEEMRMEVRDPLNLLYLAFTQDHHPALEDVQVRQAIAHALNRQAMVDAVMAEGAEVATQFQPPILEGWNPDVPQYDYDPARAADLLAQAGYEEGELELDFWYPTDVTRPYMPDPQSIFELFRVDLEAAGIVVNPVSRPWTPEYLNEVQNGEADLHFLGWTGDYPEAFNFLGTWFSRPLPQWGFDNESIFNGLAEADAEPDGETRNQMYQELNAEIMEFLPGVPISHTPVAIVFAPNVTGVEASPLLDEVFATAQISE